MADKTPKALIDINGKTIKVGDKVKTTQPSGGILPPAKPTIGVVELKENPLGEIVWAIHYIKQYQGNPVNAYIDLDQKINEII